MSVKKSTEAAAVAAQENRWSTALLISLITVLIFLFASSPATTSAFGIAEEPVASTTEKSAAG